MEPALALMQRTFHRGPGIPAVDVSPQIPRAPFEITGEVWILGTLILILHVGQTQRGHAQLRIVGDVLLSNEFSNQLGHP